MTERDFGTDVDLPLAVPVVFDYLADPRNRPEWQSSLLSVTLRERRQPYVGMRWRETTLVGVRPRMEIIELEPGRTWSERGTWHGVSADLALRFEETASGCRVRATGRIRGRGPWAVAALAAGRLAPLGIRADLRKAGRILADRGAPENR